MINYHIIQFARRYGQGLTILCVGLTLFWILILVVLPYLYLLENSFRPYLPAARIGGPEDTYRLDNYLTFFTSRIHIAVFLKTVAYSVIVTILAFLIAYPVAFHLSQMATRRAAAAILPFLLLPLCVSEVLRGFAWYGILSLKGPLNFVLLELGLIDKPVRWLSGFQGIIIGLIYTYGLFMLFPVYGAMRTLERSQLEAARDLGATSWRVHWRIVLPHSKPGIASGAVMVFMLSAGSILIPAILGSPNSRWFTQIVQQWMFDSQDWNTGAAYAFLLLVTCTIFVLLVMRLFGVRLGDVGK